MGTSNSGIPPILPGLELIMGFGNTQWTASLLPLIEGNAFLYALPPEIAEYQNNFRLSDTAA